ncbi:MAG TPA: response regulator, partial [Candidatus Omnitrophota bacterium]|nr:response regulator [Candidatus Omnitrophota bacterium]
IVLDVNMPGIDGIETARRMKTVCPTATVTLLTANIQEPVRLQAQELGVCFMNKPFREDVLIGFLATGTVP